MILHISNDNVFLDKAIQNLERVFPGRNEYLITNDAPKYIKNISKVVALNPESENFKKYINNLTDYEAVILHALNKDKVKIVNEASKDVTFVWMFWGADGYYLPKMQKYLYTLRTKKLLGRNKLEFKKSIYFFIKFVFYPLYYCYYKNKIGRLSYYGDLKRAIKRVNYISPVIPEDYYRIKENINTKAKLLPFSYGNLEDFIDLNDEIDNNGKNILVGNSANPSNNHIDIFEKLRKINLTNRKIIALLSYGNVDNYAEKISKIGRNYFLDKYKPIYDFLAIDKYNELINSCNVVILNHMRQQAGGLVLISLCQGKKVFMNKESTIFQFYKKKNAIIFSTDEITEISLLNSLSREEVNKNKKILSEYYGKEKVLERTKEFVETLIRSS